jgi:hypothetical protein
MSEVLVGGPGNGRLIESFQSGRYRMPVRTDPLPDRVVRRRDFISMAEELEEVEYVRFQYVLPRRVPGLPTTLNTAMDVRTGRWVKRHVAMVWAMEDRHVEIRDAFERLNMWRRELHNLAACREDSWPTPFKTAWGRARTNYEAAFDAVVIAMSPDEMAEESTLSEQDFIEMERRLNASMTYRLLYGTTSWDRRFALTNEWRTDGGTT